MLYTAFDKYKWKGLPIVKMLTKKETGEEAWYRFKAVGELIAPLLEDKPMGLEYLTSHDVGHCYRIALRIGAILPPIVDLNEVEIFTLLCAILYHDSGMWCHGDDEIGQYLENEDFLKFVNQKFEAEFEIIKKLRESEKKEEKDIGLLELLRLISQWRRFVHPDRSAEILRKDASPTGIPEAVAEVAAMIIEAHGWASHEVLTNYRLNRRLVVCFDYEKNVDVRYLSFLLRLGDLLDVGKDRVPEIMKQSLGKELLPLESEVHWVKEEKLHIIEINPDTVKIGGSFNHKNDVEIKALTLAQNWINIVEAEIKTLQSFCSYGNRKNKVGLLRLHNCIIQTNTIIKDAGYLNYLEEEVHLLKGYYDRKLHRLNEDVKYIELNYLRHLRNNNINALAIDLKKMEPELSFFSDFYSKPQTKLPINKNAFDIFEKYILLWVEFGMKVGHSDTSLSYQIRSIEYNTFYYKI